MPGGRSDRKDRLLNEGTFDIVFIEKGDKSIGDYRFVGGFFVMGERRVLLSLFFFIRYTEVREVGTREK